MLFNLAYNKNHINTKEIREWVKKALEKDYNDLSDKTKAIFKEKYKEICNIVIGD